MLSDFEGHIVRVHGRHDDWIPAGDVLFGHRTPSLVLDVDDAFPRGLHRSERASDLADERLAQAQHHLGEHLGVAWNANVRPTAINTITTPDAM